MRRIFMHTKEYPKDKYGYEIPRCHYVNPTSGEDCEDAPMTGEHFCPSHNPRLEAERRLAAERAEACPGEPWAPRDHGRRRRQPEPPRIPPNLPYIKLESRAHIQFVYEFTLNYVLKGEMDLRVANSLGYLAMGALASIDSQARADRHARLDAEKAAERAAARNMAPPNIEDNEDNAQEPAETPQTQADRAAQEEAEKVAAEAPDQAGSEIQDPQPKDPEPKEDAQKTEQALSTARSFYRPGLDEYGRKQRIIYRDTPNGPEIDFMPLPPPLVVRQTNSTEPIAREEHDAMRGQPCQGTVSTVPRSG
jgi:hypothetical protein